LAEILNKFSSETDANVLVGLKTSDDAGVFQLTEEIALVQTVDFITPISDDPYIFGQVAAANSLSDVYAMGGRPITALNLCCFPGSGIDNQVLEAILRGGLDKLKEAGAALIGGHTVKDDELKYGLSVTGIVHPKKYVTNSRARPGDQLILTKPIGTGVIIGAVRSGKLSKDVLDRAIQDMVRLNKSACEAMLQFEVHACTDITGFGLAGHSLEVAKASNVGLTIDFVSLPHYPEALELIRTGVTTRMTPLNRQLVASFFKCAPEIRPEEEGLCYDPQTSGGLLISLPQSQAKLLLEKLKGQGLTQAAIIGEIFASAKPELRLVRKT
jgi:selenide,water dikinase